MAAQSPTHLSDLPVLLIDCQATAANPQTGQLLEIGWAEARARDAAKLESIAVCSYLVDRPVGEEIPRRVRRVTGLAAENFASGPTLTSQHIWEKLTEAADRICASGAASICPAVIHFARFEKAYLAQLHQELSPNDPFPLDVLCTHEITKRLLPDLPRRGLRAVAGYFGHSVPELRRSHGHLIATAVIWRRLVEILEKSHGIVSHEDLKRWLAETVGSTNTGRAYPMDPGTRLGLPNQPGIYRMRRSNGDLLYVGKAKSLNKRVNSYFQKKRHHPEHTLEMLTQAKQVDVTVTPSALEAALLESDEIKRFQPPYNIALRERDRSLAFFSTDLIQSSPEPDEIHRVGPMPSPNSLKPVGRIASLLEKEPKESLLDGWLSEALGIPAEYAPEEECFREGFTLFRSKYQSKLDKNPVTPRLTRLGAILWREKLATAEEPDDHQAEDELDEPEEQEWIWTPERVTASLENVVLRGTYWIRRSGWLCLLSESSIAWEAKDGSGKNLLIFEEGNISRREKLMADEEIPSPPGHKKKHRERQRNFDLMTLDRLIVVTTELRRLLSEGRDVAVRLRPTTTLRCEKLTQTFRWI